jgi:bacteriorhodopsin
MQISLVKNSFYFTYIFLITTGTICFIEALRNPDPKVRHIMNLETCISVVAGYFYGLFVAKIDKSEKDKKNEEMPLEEINDNRYTDWAISTPLMLLVLCLVLGMENKHIVNFWTFMLILLFNFLMLGAGYIGEVGTLSKTSANMLGFVFFTLMYGTIWNVYMKNKKTINSQVIFWLFVVLWAFYGVFYQTNTLTKIFGYNILDLLSKAFVGIFFWLYLTKSVKF